MRRGTTPTHTFTLSLDPAVIKKVRITYEQDGFKLVKNDCAINGHTVSVTLTQDETLSFKDNKPARVQLKVLDQTDKVTVSDIMTFVVYECLDHEVLA